MAELLELDRAIFGKHAYDEDDIRGFYKNPYFSPWVFVDSNEFVGAMFISKWDDRYHIHGIGLLPEYRNRGLGTSAINFVDSMAVYDKLDITTRVKATNNSAIRLFKRSGFGETHIEELAYENTGEPGIHLIKKY